MLFFYAPWCIRCNKFHPEYDKAASILKNENLFLAKVDATVEKKLDKKFEITGFPVLKLFIKGKPVEYNGERNHEDLIKWIRKKTNGIAIEELNSEEDLDIFKQSSDAVLVYYGEDENDIKICTKIARKDDEIPFGIIKDKTLREKYANNFNKIILYKNFDEKKNELNIIKEKEIEVLKLSIEKREKLLANENYVNKAPKKIVDLDREKLELEKKKLAELLK